MAVALGTTMTPEIQALSKEPLNKLLDDLVTARLEKRQADIERLEQEICKRQACGEHPKARVTVSE